jgi:REP element-mobilizing transposase RayT
MKMISAEVEGELFAFIGGVCKRYDGRLLSAGASFDHIHLLVSVSKNHSIPTMIGDIKRSSSKWLKTKGGMLTKFGWQDGYSAFSVGHTQLETVKNYVLKQREHHAKMLFEDEMRSFYKKYRIDFNEEYIWD